MLSFSSKKLVLNSIMKSQDENGSWMLGDHDLVFINHHFWAICWLLQVSLWIACGLKAGLSEIWPSQFPIDVFFFKKGQEIFVENLCQLPKEECFLLAALALVISSILFPVTFYLDCHCANRITVRKPWLSVGGQWCWQEPWRWE
jgi:hypothetical protein